MYLFQDKIGLINIPSIKKVIENQNFYLNFSRNYDFVYTNLSKNEADVCNHSVFILIPLYYYIHLCSDVAYEAN
jgi:hypothetical protein